MNDLLIDNSEITVVVQGPVHRETQAVKPEITTKMCVESIRSVLPGAFIILSTWKNANTKNIDYDLIIENEDPGQNIITQPEFDDRVANDNRQIKSTLEGLKQVKTKYALKIRSDNFLTHAHFKELFNMFPKRCSENKLLEKRVVICNTVCRELQKGGKVSFHVCDFFYFGLTIDLLKIWDIPYFPAVRATNLKKWQFKMSTEQYLWLSFIKKYDDSIFMSHLLDSSKDTINKSRSIIVNNLIIAEPKLIGLGIPVRFNLTLKTECTYISFMRWKILYKKHCDTAYSIPGALQYSIALFLIRLWFYGPKRLKYLMEKPTHK